MLKDEIVQYARERYGSEPEHLWARWPTYAVLRRASNRKWYAAFLDVPREKLGLPGEGVVDLLDVKCDPLLAGSLRQGQGYLPAYHMNKDRWLSVLLDGTVPREDIIELLDRSYDLTR